MNRQRKDGESFAKERRASPAAKRFRYGATSVNSQYRSMLFQLSIWLPPHICRLLRPLPSSSQTWVSRRRTMFGSSVKSGTEKPTSTI